MTTPSADAATGLPAAMGGEPLFPEGLPIARPSVPDTEAVTSGVRKILDSGILTNGPYVERLEEEVARYLGVGHVVAVSSCTGGLMLVLRATDLSGDIVLPSFTFAATAHAVAWNGLRPVFADIDPSTLTLSAEAARHAIGSRTTAILATHTYGTPCDVEGLGDVARDAGIHLFYDAAHAFGSTHVGTRIGVFGDAEVFSLTPTKPLVAGEGGVIATGDTALAEACRVGRNYAKEPDYDMRFVGLNARMSEFHAAVALASLEGIDGRLEERNRLARSYRDLLAGVPGISFPTIRGGDLSTYKDFTVLVDMGGFGLRAAHLAEALAAEGIETRRYYAPPVHWTRPYRAAGRGNGGLPITDATAERVITLPLWVGMQESDQQGVVAAIQRIRAHAGGVLRTSNIRRRDHPSTPKAGR